jgi:hypothetical protein
MHLYTGEGTVAIAEWDGNVNKELISPTHAQIFYIERVHM